MIPILTVFGINNNFILHTVNVLIPETINISSIQIKMKERLQSDNLFSILGKIGLNFLDATAIDALDKKNRFCLIYTLIMFTIKQRLFLIVPLLSPNIISHTASKIFEGALAPEREIFDMFGLFFNKHADLRRILTDYSFSGHPLKKDFPLAGYQQIQYSGIKKGISYNLLRLIQEMRVFSYPGYWTETGDNKQ